MSAVWINKLNESDSRLHKEDVLKQVLELAILGDGASQRTLEFLKDCYNPFVTFGVRQVPQTVGLIDQSNPWDDFQSLLDLLNNRKLTGHAARDAIVDISAKFDSEEWNTFCRQIILKDIRAGISEKTINKVCKKTEYEIPVFSCQLATSCDDRPEMKGVKRLEPKLDGVRTLLMVIPSDSGMTVVSYSRNGKIYENFGHIEEQVSDNWLKMVRACANVDQGRSLMDGFVFDGEVISTSFNELMKHARRKGAGAALDSVYTVFDIIPLADFQRGHWNAQLEKRIALLDALRPVIAGMKNVELLPHIMVDLDTAAGKDQFHRYCHDKVAEGFEGVMIKEMKAPYICKRSTDWMKYKPVLTVDLQVVALEEGTGKNVGRLGALVCSGTDHGKFIEVNCGSGFTDEQRDEFWADQGLVVGQTVEILCDVISQNQDGTYSLRFPRFIRFRDDK